MKASTIKYLGIDDTRILLYGIPFAGFVITLSLHEVNPVEAPLWFLRNYLFSCVYTTFYWLTNRQIILFLESDLHCLNKLWFGLFRKCQL